MPVTVCVPTVRLLIENVAVVPPVTAPVPIDTPPSSNVTVPVGVPAPGLVMLTVAVKVIDWPNTDGLLTLVTVVVVLALVTVCKKLADVLPEKLLLPL